MIIIHCNKKKRLINNDNNFNNNSDNDTKRYCINNDYSNDYNNNCPGWVCKVWSKVPRSKNAF